MADFSAFLDTQLLELIINDNHNAFKEAFLDTKEYCMPTSSIRDECLDKVQEIFSKMWSYRHQLFMHVLRMNSASPNSDEALLNTRLNHLHHASKRYWDPADYAKLNNYLPFRHKVAQVAVRMSKSPQARLSVFVLFLVAISILGILILIFPIFFRPEQLCGLKKYNVIWNCNVLEERFH